MAAPQDVRTITTAVLARSYDLGALSRGRRYADEGRARLQSSGPGSVKAVVIGSGRNTYLVRVDWDHDGRDIRLTDSCTCPLGGRCKHAVAAVLTAQWSAPEPEPEAPWRQALAPIVGGLSEDRGPDPNSVPLALELTVERPAPTRYAPAPEAKAVVRPLRQGRNGRWIKSNVSWRDLSYRHSYGAPDLDADQLGVLRAMQASSRSANYYSEPAAIPLSAFGRDLWFHLARAVETGITLVGRDGAAGAVKVSTEPASVAVDLAADGSGSVLLSARLVVAGETVAIDREAFGVLGDPAHGLFHQADGVLHLVALANPVPAGLARLLSSAPLVVPPDDVDDLLTTYQPLLSRLAPVGSSDGTVTITATELDGLVVVVERPEVDVADLRWMVRYRRGERVIDQPLPATASFRDRRAEQALLDVLEVPTHLLAGLGDGLGPVDRRFRGPAAVTLLTEVVPWLTARGQVQVEVRGEAPELREAVEDPLVALSVRDREQDDTGRTDWFDLDVEVSVDGEVVPFVPLFSALAQGDEVLVLPSGTWLRLDRPELESLRKLIEEARGLSDRPDGPTVAVNRFQLGWWDELTALGVVRNQSARWERATAQLGGLVAPEPVELPSSLQATLRPYQHEGFDWLAFLHRHGLGGILADDMGLGKTVQTLALCLHILEQDPSARFLVVAPTSVVENWHREAEQFAPSMSVRTIHETENRRGTDLATEIGDARLVVTSYALFRIEYESYAAMDWELLLLDEAQFVKNHQGKTYQCVRRLDAPTKIAITGTPLENSLMDLWSLLSITAPGLFPDPKRFSSVYRKPIESGRSPEMLATLRRRIAPLMRRRTKDEVLKELPPKIEQTVEVELSPRHARLYQTQLQRQRQKVLGLVGDVQKHRFEILKSLTLLRQLSLDPALIDPEHEKIGSAKLDRLEEDLIQVVAEGHRALVFSQFTRYLARVRKRLEGVGIDYAYLDGRTKKRAEAIDSFRSGDVPVFVISLKAGGFGLNLTEADYCFILDPWWNPAVEAQAVDRTHRIGQTNPVVVYRYVATGTIEEKVMELKARKAALFTDVIDADGALSGALTEDDIRGLFD